MTGMTYRLALSTRPEKVTLLFILSSVDVLSDLLYQGLGDKALWDIAESQLAEALDEFAGNNALQYAV